MLTFAVSIIFSVLFVLVLGSAIAMLLRRVLPTGAVRWTKLLARIGMVVVTVYTTVRIITCFIPGGLVQVQLNFQSFWPRIPAAIHYFNPAERVNVAAGGFNSATVYVANADLASRLWLAAGWLIWGLMVITLCFTAERIAQALQVGGEFRQISGKWIRRVAWIVLVGGHLAKWLTDIGQNLVAYQLQQQNYGFDVKAVIKNPWLMDGTNPSFNHVYGIAVPTAGIYFNIEMWVVLVSVGLFVLARIFESGKRLEQDSEGLV